MNSRLLTGVLAVLVAAGAVVCLGPWYGSGLTTAWQAAVKMGAEAAGAVFALRVFRRYGSADGQRWPWLILGVSLGLWLCGQSVLSYHQVLLGEATPFPSWGDPPFVAGSLLAVTGLGAFAWQASRSGLPLGSPLLFWAPALVTAVLLAVAAYPIFAPIVNGGGSATERFLNIYYPLASFICLAPCAVMLRVGILFRGGRLIWVWLPLTVGFVLVLSSDVLFSYFTTLGLAGVEPVMDLFYYGGYLLIARGVLFQWELMRQ